MAHHFLNHATLSNAAAASMNFSRFDEGLILRADDEYAGAEPSGVEKMVADAVSDLKSFCDSMRADFDTLKGRMDSMEKPARADDVTEEGDVSGVAIETPTDGVIETKPASALAEDAPADGDRVAAAEDAAIEAAVPAAMAADDQDMSMMADSLVRRATAPLRADIERLQRMMPAELTIEQRQQFATAQEQAETAFQSFGDHAPAPLQGESISTYKRRLASKMQPHSKKWGGTKLTGISDAAMLDVVIGEIYNDAVAVARRGSDVAAGKLMPVTRRTPAGHTIIEYRGSVGAWMRPLAGATRRATGKFNTGR